MNELNGPSWPPPIPGSITNINFVIDGIQCTMTGNKLYLTSFRARSVFLAIFSMVSLAMVAAAVHETIALAQYTSPTSHVQIGLGMGVYVACWMACSTIVYCLSLVYLYTYRYNRFLIALIPSNRSLVAAGGQRFGLHQILRIEVIDINLLLIKRYKMRFHVPVRQLPRVLWAFDRHDTWIDIGLFSNRNNAEMVTAWLQSLIRDLVNKEATE